jgi:adenylate cyclase 10
MNERKFFFAAENEESLESWTIYIEFAKAKAVYDEFVFQFGRIQFPLGSQTDGFDQSIRFDVSLKVIVKCDYRKKDR